MHMHIYIGIYTQLHMSYIYIYVQMSTYVYIHTPVAKVQAPFHGSMVPLKSHRPRPEPRESRLGQRLRGSDQGSTPNLGSWVGKPCCVFEYVCTCI